MKPLRLIFAAALAAGIVYTGMVAARSPALDLKTVELVGAQSGRVSLADVVRAGGLRKGTSLLRLPTGRAADRIESLPWVLHARVERILPSKIRVTIQEATPAFVVVSGGAPWEVDKHGTVLERADTGLVHILDIPLAGLHPGSKVSAPQFENAVRILQALTPPIRNRLNLVRAASVDRITLELVDGSSVIYGAAEQMADKNYAVRKLLELYDGRGVPLESIDVRVPSRPAVRARLQPSQPEASGPGRRTRSSPAGA